MRALQRPVAAGIGAVVLMGWFAFSVLSGGMGACAAPPPGWHRVTPLWSYLGYFGPAAIAFGVSAYLALGVRTLLLRWIAVVASVGIAGVVFVATAVLVVDCGTYAP